MKSDSEALVDPVDVKTHPQLRTWFHARGWRPLPFQEQCWQAIASGRSGLLHATTGTGKTYAAWLGILNAVLNASATPAASESASLQALWITPMRALASDTLRALAAPLEVLCPHWTLGRRTGDTPASERARQSRRLPHALVSTPESLSLLLARAGARATFAQVKYVVIDEWHELLGSKRGTQTMLAIARLAEYNPQLIVWGLSATLGNVAQALQALTGSALPPGILLQGREPKPLAIDTLIPETIERFPWGGHLGTRMVAPVVREIESAQTTLIFTNTRAQAEHWYRALLAAMPQWAGVLALHHGSLDSQQRDWVEHALKAGQLKAVVATSSLDLGVDFLPVERVLQIGSAKGVARLLQRAGRSGHAPGRTSRITLVPTHALELIEAAAARSAAKAAQLEPRIPPEKPFDVLIQHLVSVALGDGFEAQALYEEVITSYAYRTLSRAEFEWCLRFVEGGGRALTAYPDYHRVVRDAEGVYRVTRPDIARRHRMSIGTITSEAMMQVTWLRGGRLGVIEEGFVSRLSPGDVFTFAGHTLEFVRVHQLTVYVRRSKSVRGAIPRWNGGRMPLSNELAHAALHTLAQAHAVSVTEPELSALAPLLQLQAQWSSVPREAVLVCEALRSREGYHFFCYPFAGRSVHLAMSALLAYRVAQREPATFSIAVNDYGFELVCAHALDWRTLVHSPLFLSVEHLVEHMWSAVNASLLPQRRFREIARIAGLIFQGYPGAPKSARQLQASSGLFYDVFRNYDPDNLLLAQAQQEALSQELEIERLTEALHRLQQWQIEYREPPHFTPFGFGLMVERMRERLSTEQLDARVARLLAQHERAAQQRVRVPR